MTQNSNLLEEHLYDKYLEYRNIQILKPARIKMLLGLGILIMFGFLDIHIYSNYYAMFTRILPISFILLFYILDYLYFRKNKTKNVLLLYNSFFVSLLVMIYIIYLTNALLPHTGELLNAEGVILISAIAGIEIKGRLSTLMSIFIIPFVIFSVALLLFINSLPSSVVIQFAHIFTITVIMIMVSYYIENKNYNTYIANIKLEIEKNKTQTLCVNLMEQKEEIESQHEEIIQQRDAAEDQRNILEAQKKEITDSLIYAQRIQQALLPNKCFFEKNFSDHFVLYKPKDIVSGDFYWSTLKSDILIFAVADCTGHGVPAGFMSMLGFSFIEEITSRNEIIEVDNILNSMRKNIIAVLDQNHSFGSAKDGMDIGLCAYNTKTSELHFAGANFNLVVIRNNDVQPVIDEIKGDKMPISIYYKMQPFTLNTTKVEKGDILYLFSDGYYDQFGGALGKKIKSRVFKNLLLSVSNKKCEIQKNLLEEYLDGWMHYSTDAKSKNYEQNDDITILGIRI